MIGTWAERLFGLSIQTNNVIRKEGIIMSMNRVKKSVSVENESVTFGFDGNNMEFRLDQLPGEMITRLALHGLSQKLGDSYADSTKVTDPQSAATDVWNNLKEGNWGRERGSSVDYDALIAEANGRLESYINSSDEEKILFAKMGITRAALEKAVTQAIKAKEKALKAKK